MDQAQYKEGQSIQQKISFVLFCWANKKFLHNRHNGENATDFPIAHNNCIDLHSAGFVFLGVFSDVESYGMLKRPVKYSNSMSISLD